MHAWNQLLFNLGMLDKSLMPVKWWNWYIKVLGLAFIAYWLHLSQHLNEWLGSEGFHFASPVTMVFAPLLSPLPQLLWWITLTGSFLLFFSKSLTWGCCLTGGGFFYATMCDPASAGALNMHFLFALTVIFWSSGLKKPGDVTMSAWPAYLIRVYLVVVYFGSGWRKVIYGNWLTDPNALIQCIAGFYTTDLTRRLYSIMPQFAWTFAQYITIAFELGAPLLLLYPPLRKTGVILGCLLHIGIAFLMKDLVYFSFQMLTFYLPVLTPTSHLASVSPKNGHQSAI